ncbi:MAG: class I SAM-dependent methyltransferase [bacterium]|nr:class I SAM-dependent methyltransferase [bacterium]
MTWTSGDGMPWNLKSILASPVAYELLQTFFGYRARFAREYVRADENTRILDIGCGPARILDYLPHGVQYVGFDMSERYIAAARARYGHRAEFHCALVGTQEFAIEPCDVALAVGVLHHLDDAAAVTLFEGASAHLKSEGTLVTLDPAFAADQCRAARWFARHDRGAHVRSVEEYRRLADRTFSTVDVSVVSDLYSVPYTICIMRCSARKNV